jgi:hypothetical protein
MEVFLKADCLGIFTAGLVSVSVARPLQKPPIPFKVQTKNVHQVPSELRPHSHNYSILFFTGFILPQHIMMEHNTQEYISGL